MKVCMLVLLASVLLVAETVNVTSIDCSQFSNGCSIPFGSNFFYKDTFRPACDRHDACYKCGVIWSISRSTCDHAFRSNMKQICRENFRRQIFSYVRCKTAANIYFAAVRTGGILGYKRRPKPWCNDSVRACVPH